MELLPEPSRVQKKKDQTLLIPRLLHELLLFFFFLSLDAG